MTKNKLQTILYCLAIIYIVILLKLLFAILALFPSNAYSSDTINTINIIANGTIHISMLIMIFPLMDFFKLLYQKNKED